MDLEQIVQQILTARRDLTREDVLKKIYEKKHSAGDYFLDEVAARLVASELGVEIPSTEEGFSRNLRVKDLITGLNDVTIVGRVIATNPIHTFSRSDLTEGRVARLTLADKSGTAQLVLWDDKTSLIDAAEIEQGDIIRVLHGYVREGFDGKLELHLGQRGDIQVSPKDVVENDYPLIGQLVDKIGSLTNKNKRVNVCGTICDIYPQSEFRRKDGTNGKVRRLRLRDDTEEITVVVWNEKVDELGEVNKGEQIRLTNARVKTQLDSRLELHIESGANVEKLVGQSDFVPIVSCEATSRIADLKGGGPFTIEASVATTPDVREVTTAQKEQILVASFDLEDNTGKIRMTLWRSHAEIAGQLLVGSRIRVKNVYAKRGFSNLLELTSRSSTTIEVVSKPETLSTETKLE